MRGAKIIPPTENIKAILQKLGDLPQEARKEAETIAQLKNEIVQLRRHKCENVPHQKRLKSPFSKIARSLSSKKFYQA